ncbi:Trm112 family protein [Streptomyces ortus]|uniref:Trm112 family protein n=1 Tax=Streptomyces ortus TaxID=2867268 RepID=A0ABT3VC32_9ACTN|nr:Trm112 family protein [Streptomyces ortus]MCX4236205.1 Trm112 family protein [Streptomyces ortus]
MPLEAGLLEILACPACHAPLKETSSKETSSKEHSSTETSAAEQQQELLCTGQDCGLAYPVRDDIPVLLVDEARRPA